MRLSRLSLPFSSPSRIAAKLGRVFLDMVNGVPTLKYPDESEIPLGYQKIANYSTALAALVFEQSMHGALIRKGNGASAHTLTILQEGTFEGEEEGDPSTTVAYVDGTFFTVKNTGTGTLTITGQSVDSEPTEVTFSGTAAILPGYSAKVIRVDENLWDILPYDVDVS
jgi:hypothetical protein